MQEKNALKALNSFAIRDVIDGVDSPLIILEASIKPFVTADLFAIKIHAVGGITGRVGEMSCYYNCHVICLHLFTQSE